MTDQELILRSRLEETERRLMEAETEIERLNEINALRVPGSCQCGDDEVCEFARRAEAAEARVRECCALLDHEKQKLCAAAKAITDAIGRIDSEDFSGAREVLVAAARKGYANDR